MTDESKKNLGGRPVKELDDDDFDKLVAMIRIQCTAEEIAGVFGVSSDTIDRRLKERGEAGFAELRKKHMSEGKASLRRAQWSTAMGVKADKEAGIEAIPPSPTMQIWLGKQVLGQRDFMRQEVTGKDGAPVTVTTLDASKLSDDVLNELMAAKPTAPADGTADT